MICVFYFKRTKEAFRKALFPLRLKVGLVRFFIGSPSCLEMTRIISLARWANSQYDNSYTFC